jgi:ELWxxDGT repeat protein
MRAPTAWKAVSLGAILTAAVFAAVSAGPAAASDGVAYRVKDIDTNVSALRNLEVQPAASLGAAVLAFPPAAHYQSLGAGELWVTDGTTAGTRLVRDLHGGGLHEAVALAGGILFVADSPATGYEIWWTDGTTAGTRLVDDIRPGPSSSMPSFVGVLGGVAYIAADDGEHGRELWRSDGTAAGTWLFVDIDPGAAGSLAEWDDPDRAGAIFDGALYFAADDGVHGRELWRSNGHSAGTYLLKSIAEGPAGGDPRSFQAAAGKLFFTASDAAHGSELWATDGSAAGTALVRDLVPGATGALPSPLGRVPGLLVFYADSPEGQLWVSDGTAGGTHVIPGVPARAEGVTLGSRVVFVADESGRGRTLWVTDGTAAGTTRTRDDLTGVRDLRSAGSFALLVADFEDQDGIWRSDGTAGGTLELSDGNCDEMSDPVAAGGAWLFGCRVYVGPHGWDAVTLFRTDGTPPGSGEVTLSWPRGSGSGPRSLTARTGGIVFTTRVSGWEVVGSDGTEAGTYPLQYTGTGGFGGFDGGARLVDGEVVFPSSADDVGDGQLFRTDGGLVSVVKVIDNGGVWPKPIRVGEQVFFTTDSLWVTDGTAAGTALIRAGVHGFEQTDVFGKLWLVGDHDEGSPATLWESAGSYGTTSPHPLSLATGSDEPNALTPLDPAVGSLVFRALGGLYRFDPATGAARRFVSLSPTAPPSYEPWPRATVAETYFFFDGNADGTCALWRSDGTPAGTGKVRDIGVWGCWPIEIVALGDRVYFPGCDATRGCELWRSDGTTAGTVRVTDLDPGVFSSMPSDLTVVEGRIYFSACDPWHGCEPWVTDGTRAGTHRLGDIAPGPPSSFVSQLTASDRLVFFSADDGTGTELWAAPVEIFYDGFETGDLSRWEVFPDARGDVPAGAGIP